jgi:hypothetical protein
MTQIYGELQSEKMALQNLQARKIVKEINMLGASDRQKLLIIYLLGLELEKLNEMQTVTNMVKTLRGDIFVTSLTDEDTQQE